MKTMEELLELKKQLVAHGRLSSEEIDCLRNAIFDNEGMSKEKGDFLFDLKDNINKEHVDESFVGLFVDAITSLLLEDDVSPGEIDDSEAKWLRAKIQYKGYFDSLDEALLDNLRRKSINFPDILNYKSKLARRFENGLYYSRYLALFAVVGAILSAIALFIRGSVVVIQGLVDFFESFNILDKGGYEKLIEAFVSSVDIYLFAMVLIIFGMGVYELFINKIDPVERKSDSRPTWLQISSIDDLKSSLGKVILMVLIVSFFKNSLVITYHSAQDLLLLALGVVLIALSLFIANSSHTKQKKQKHEGRGTE